MSDRTNEQLARRDALKALAAVGAVGAAGAVASGAVATSQGNPSGQGRARAAEHANPPEQPWASRPPSGEVAAFFGPLTAGTQVARWRIEAIHDVQFGAIPVVLSTASGERFQVDVLRRDALGTNGVGHATSVTVALANGGSGDQSSHEEHGLGAMALGDALEAREQSGARVPSGILTLAQRVERFPRGLFSVVA